MLRHRFIPFALVVLVATACQELPTDTETESTPAFARSQGASRVVQRMLDETNLALAAEDAAYRAFKAEYITHSSSDEAGNVVHAKNVGNKRLEDDFVPHDPRREDWSGPAGGANDDITYAIDQTADAVPPLGGLSAAETDAAIVRAMESWDDLTCSSLDLTRNNDFGLDLGLLAFQIFGGLAGGPFVVADIMHAGWGDVPLGMGVLGVTVTFVFIDDDDMPTDIDGNGRADVAFREIYYSTAWTWADDGVSDVDVESVAVHEAGHGLSQAHFGTVRTLLRGRNDNVLKASPRAVMNALYSAPFRDLVGSDVGGHCSNWANWPQN